MESDDFRQLSDLLPEPMFLVGIDGQILAANQAAGDWLSVDAERLTGQPLTLYLEATQEQVGIWLQPASVSPTRRELRLFWRLENHRVRESQAYLGTMIDRQSGEQRWLLRCETVGISHGQAPASQEDINPATPAPAAAPFDSEHLASLIDSSLDAVIGRDLQGLIVSWNAGAERMFGYTAREMLGTTLERLIPEDRQHEHQLILETTRRGETVDQMETLRRAKDGRLIEVSITSSPIVDRNGRMIGTSTIPRDISQLKSREREIARFSRLYAALSQVNQAIVWLPDRDELFHKVCRVLVEYGGFRMAWIGWRDRDGRMLKPVAQFGDDGGYLDGISVSLEDGDLGRGPSGTAYRSGEPSICNQLLSQPSMSPWRERARKLGFESCGAFPIRVNGEVQGLLNVYAVQPEFFHDKEVELLAEAALDISFALGNLEREAARKAAEVIVRQERDFSNAVLQSLPGVLYLYDQHGKFLRWNRNFEEVTGYSGAEIAQMHPLDFFQGGDRLLIAAKIEDVFTSGASNVEANFLTKSGHTIPYYFTGVRTPIEGRHCLIGVGIDISRQRKSERLRYQSDARYPTLFDCAPDGIVISNLQGEYVDANPSLCEMLGYRREELIGLHATEIVAPSEVASVQPTLDSLGEYRHHQRQWRMRRRDGSLFPAEVLATRMPDGLILAMIRDVTERMRVEKQLRDSESRLLQAQRIARMGSWELDLATQELSWSDPIYDIFELERSDFARSYESFMEWVHPEDRDSLEAAQHAALTNQARLNIEHRIVLPDGREKFLLEQADLKYDASGQAVALAGICLDISDRKRAEREREKRHRAEAADRVKSVFLATMSHELRTPLNSIIGFTGIVLQGLAGPLNEEQSRQLQMVRGSARHLLALVNDVLDISKIEAGQLELAQSRFNPQVSIRAAVTLVEGQARDKGLQLTLKFDPEADEIEGDARRFEQILINLLNNAVKFTEQGEIRVWTEHVELRFVGEDQPRRFLCVHVADTGIGIPPQHLPELFQPFRQVDSGLNRAHEGTGLGLAICRRLTELMGGHIEVESVFGAGSEFRVTIPIAGAPRP